MDQAGRLAQRWPAVVSALQAVESTKTVRPCTSVQDVQTMLDVLAAVDDALARYDPSVFDLDLDRLRTSLSRGRSVVGRVWAICTNRDFRASRAALLASRTAGKVSVGTLLQELDELRSVLGDGGTSRIRTPPRVLSRTPQGCDTRSAKCSTTSRADPLLSGTTTRECDADYAHRLAPASRR